MKYLFWPQWYENRNQLQKKKLKIHTYAEIKQLLTNSPKKKSQRKLENILRQMKIKHINDRTFVMHWEQC